ncbi:homoserine kinase [Nocardioides litoris]|uniref:homoserine kinase n=1 Tax=Nocardioides litoris TaxID=1926648 RepID=UPI0011232D47|nr:homoserine kinase [Nocardioides litoris]
MTFVAGPVRVDVPATSANLGPGFDTLGLALDLHDELEGEVVDRPGLEVVVDGEGAGGGVPLDETHLVVRAMHAAFDALGERPAGLRLRCRNRVPHARGLGSSSAAIVGGVVLARALVVDGAERLADADAFDLTARLEGHPDNVAPAFFGGFTVSGHAEGRFWSVRSPVADGIAAVAFVPPDGVSTEAARGLLPDAVPHRDAAANAGAAALLVTALAGAPERLLLATADRLHQDYREPAMPASLALVRALRGEGHAAVVSGAGPTVLVLTTPTSDVDGLVRRVPEGWRVLRLAVSDRGAAVHGAPGVA